MKYICAILLAIGCTSVDAGQGLSGKCVVALDTNFDMPKLWSDMVSPCEKLLRKQVKVEVDAATTYLAMAAHFARDTINRPGFSKFFFDNASEERQHAIKVIEYLLMRGKLTGDINDLLKFSLPSPSRDNWIDGVDALRDALNLETDVTGHIRDIIQTCESPKEGKQFNDYHLVDYFTGDFLDEQYRGERDLAGKLTTLGKMMKQHGTIGEFLFDKKLLDGAV